MKQINRTTPIHSLHLYPLDTIPFSTQTTLMADNVYFVGDLLSKSILEYLQSPRSHISLISIIFLLHFLNENNLHWEGEEEILFRKEDLYDKDMAGLLVVIDKRILSLKSLKYTLEVRNSKMSDLDKRKMQYQCEEIKAEIESLWQQALELKELPSLK